MPSVPSDSRAKAGPNRLRKHPRLFSIEEKDEGIDDPTPEPIRSKPVAFGQQPQRETLLDPYGLPLSPQPIPDHRDPLTWSHGRKLNILAHISIMSFLSQFLANSISPALWPLHRDLAVTFGSATHIVGVYVAFVGIGPLLFNPLANTVGRRPLLITSLIGTAGSAIAAGLSKSYLEIIIFRSLNGLFASISIGLGSVIVCDLFYQYERGLYMGIYMVIQFSGGHLGPMIGGYIYKATSWHWCFFLPAIASGLLLFTLAFTVPETLYSRAVESLQRPFMSLYQQELIRKKRENGRRLKLVHFLHPIKMLKYPSVLLPSIYYSAVSGYANMIFVVSSAALFHHFYHFKAWQTGLLLGTPLTFGSWIGEFGAGGFSDWVTERRAINRGKRIPEDRLLAMLPGVVLAPLGLLVEGFCLHHQVHWAGAGLGIGIASAGFQIVTTVTYAYIAECYPRQTAETATVLNFGRQMFSFGVPFYNATFTHRIGVQTAFLIYAAAELASFVPIVVLIIKGTQWRDSLGGPEWNQDL